MRIDEGMSWGAYGVLIGLGARSGCCARARGRAMDSSRRRWAGSDSRCTRMRRLCGRAAIIKVHGISSLVFRFMADVAHQIKMPPSWDLSYEALSPCKSKKFDKSGCIKSTRARVPVERVGESVPSAFGHWDIRASGSIGWRGGEARPCRWVPMLTNVLAYTSAKSKEVGTA
jgi:hypothetical protein